MTEQRDPDRLIRAFLAEGQTELPDRAYDAVRDSIDHTRQRVVIGPWREPRMSNIARVALAAAAVLALAVVGSTFLPRSNGLVGGAPVPSPTISPSPSAVLLPATGDLIAGTTYAVEDANVTPSRFTFVVPAGWQTFNYALIGKTGGGANGPDSSRAGFSPWLATNIYVDPCRWQSSGLAISGSKPTVDQLATALSQQVGRNGSAPTDVTVGGYSGKKVELFVATDFNKASCDAGLFKTWLEGGGGGGGDGGYVYRAGQHNSVYILDVKGTPLFLDTMDAPGATAADKAELQAIVDSIRIEP